MKILIAIIIFSAIILIHELGHFLLAKINGISVTEFSLGMGPRLFSIQKGETRYSVKLLPLGGSCAMVGEDTAEEELPGSFNVAPWMSSRTRQQKRQGLKPEMLLQSTMDIMWTWRRICMFTAI